MAVLPPAVRAAVSLVGLNDSRDLSTLFVVPIEILVHILTFLDTDALCMVLKVSRYFRVIIDTHWIQILQHILERDYKPVDRFFQLLADLKWSSATGLGTPGPLVTSLAMHSSRLVLQVCRVVETWERDFSRLRFAPCFLDARLLDPVERERVRRALYSWWRYALRFHGRSASWDAGNLGFISQLSSAEIWELGDLWATIGGTIANDLCPSHDKVRELLVCCYSVRLEAYVHWLMYLTLERENQVRSSRRGDRSTCLGS